MRYEHLFVIDPLESLNKPLDSSLRMMFELTRLGDCVRVCEPRELAWKAGETTARVRCRRLTFAGSAVDFRAESREEKSLGDFAAVHMRKDPPYDMDYVATTWLLDTARGKARIYNDPVALRRYNEKLAILNFPKDCRDALVSSDPETLLQFIEQVGGDAILKPLHLFGGRGIERIQLNGGLEAARAKLKEETGDGVRLRLVQAFDPAIFQGEVRVFTAFSEPLAWCLKKPAAGSFLANTRAGAVLESYEPTPAERERVVRVARALQAEGVVFLGFDLIGGYVSEINLTSPRLLQAPSDRTNYYEPLAALVKKDLQA